MFSRKVILAFLAFNAGCDALRVAPIVSRNQSPRTVLKTSDTTRFLPLGSAATDAVNGVETEASNGAAPAAPAVVPAVADSTSLMETPAGAFQIFASKGETASKTSNLKLLVSALLGGSYVGMGAMLSLAISGTMYGVSSANPGLSKLVYAVLFPVNLLLCVCAGGSLFTGNTAAMAGAICEKKANFKDLARVWSIAYVGNLIACSLFAVACKYCGVLSGGAADLAAATLVSKTSAALGPTIVKALLCNWLVCLAMFMSFTAKDMVGKYVGILLPISTFVAIGFEHSVANMFLLPAGLLCSSAVSIKTAFLKNLLPVTIGNAISGSLLVGVMFSFMFGKLGEGK